MTRDQAAKELQRFGRYLGKRGLAPGGSGNLSVKLDRGYLATATGSRLTFLDPEKLALLNDAGKSISDVKPSKEIQVHLAFYRTHPGCNAVVHLHAPNAIALSCMKGLDSRAPLPPLTPYFVMRVGRLGLLPYYPPGSDELVSAVDRAGDYSALLLRNHGFIIGGRDLDDAVANAEELEETARIFLQHPKTGWQELTPDQVAYLEQKYHAGES